MGGRPAARSPVAVGRLVRRPPGAPSRQAGGRRLPTAAGRMLCRTATLTLQNPRVVMSRTGGGCLMATPSRAGCAGSGTASGASRPLGVAGCGSGSGVF
jgi:hypothetical protein